MKTHSITDATIFNIHSPDDATTSIAALTSAPHKRLSRLAELAEAVSLQRHEITPPPHSSNALRVETTSTSTAMVSPLFKTNPFEAVSAVLRKRPLMAGASRIGGAPTALAALGPKAAKRLKTTVTTESTEEEKDEDVKGVRFREYQAEIWSEKFEDLCEFRRMFGHCHVPHTYTQNSALAQWVKRQRYQYKLKMAGKRSTLSDERVRLLDKIGFIWNSHDVVWEERLNELILFKQQQGHCVVPSNYEKNPQLAVWVKRQRRQYKFYQEKKATSMTPERIEKLNRIGFAWDCRKSSVATSGVNVSTSSSLTGSASADYSADTDSDSAMMQRSNHSTPAPESQSQLGLALRGGFPMSSALLHQIKAPANSQEDQATSGSLPPSTLHLQSISSAQTTEDPNAAVPSLPCEFFSFSRKFTKFPKIKVSHEL